MATDMEFFRACIQAQIDGDRARCAAGGWEFRERPDGGQTIGDLIGAVMAIADAESAGRFYCGYIAYLETLPAADRSERYTNEQVARANIGWCFGEGMDGDRRAMWALTTGAAHPVFGTMTPTPAEAFQAGIDAASAL